MTRTEFSVHVVEERLKKIRTVLSQKAGEYANNGNFDHNFQEAARIKNESPEEALWGMAAKHLVSVQDLVYGRQKLTKEAVDEKIGDLVNYLILLEGILIESVEQKEIDFNETLKEGDDIDVSIAL